jgi:hypothetical protein
MRGGGHNANEFPARIAAEGGGPTDYRRTTAVEDPVTGVSIDQITRNQMGGNAANPQTVLDPVTGQPVQQSALKSLFPPSMDRASIQAAGQRALELASGGAPGTTYTTPPGPNQNGSFSAIVTTPDGHPIRVQGFYSLDAAGQPVIRTVYPATDIQGPTPSIPPVPGSRTNVPGAATPPTYTRDDDEN